MPAPTHGLTNSKTYISWRAMMNRCVYSTLPIPRGYKKKYEVCDRWKKFVYFLEDMGLRPEGTLLDRVDGTKGYSKDNCRWVTYQKSVLNTSRTRKIKINDEIVSLREAAKRIGVKYHHLLYLRQKGRPLPPPLVEIST